MTQLTPGKRVRWSVEGTVAADGEYIRLDDTSDYLSPSTIRRGSIELLPDPLPNTPGSVARWQERNYLRQDDGFWATQSGASVNDALLAGTNFTVLFDAGAPRD